VTVRKRPDGRWQLDIVIHRRGVRERIREACGHEVRNRSDAQAYERRRRAELDAGAPTGKAPTFAEHAEEVHRVLTTAKCKPSTRSTERCLLDVHLLPALGDLRLDEIGQREIAHLTAKVRETCEPGTVNNVLAKLRKILRVAVDWGRLAKAPKIPRLKMTRTTKPDFLDFDEAARLLVAFDAAWRPMGLCALRAGLRRSELIELRWLDIDIVAGMLHVQRANYRGEVGTPKGGRSRSIPLSEELRVELQRMRQLHAPGELVFCHPSGRAWTHNEVLAPLLRACKRAGLRPLGGWHVLRHTFASHLVMRGVSLKTVQELMGHARIEETMIYAHLTPEVRREAVMLLDAPVPTKKKDSGAG
jgi:integrase